MDKYDKVLRALDSIECPYYIGTYERDCFISVYNACFNAFEHFERASTDLCIEQFMRYIHSMLEMYEYMSTYHAMTYRKDGTGADDWALITASKYFYNELYKMLQGINEH